MHESVRQLRSYLRQRVWNNDRLGDRERTLALYLLTGEQTNEAGLFCLAARRAAQRIGCGPAEIEAHLTRTVEVQRWRWDGEAGVLWITDWFAAFPPQDRKDLPRLMELVRQLPQSPLVAEWCRRTDDLPDCLREPFTFSVAAVLAPGVLVADELAVVAPPPAVLTNWTFAVKGGAWSLEEWRYLEYRKRFGGAIDLDRELTEAQVWCRDNPLRRKKSNGMPRFLTGWLQRSRERQHGQAVSRQIERRRLDPRGNAAALQSFIDMYGGK